MRTSRMTGQVNLADGSSWGLIAGNAEAGALVSQLTEAMRLNTVGTPERHLLVVSAGNNSSQQTEYTLTQSRYAGKETLVCSLPPAATARNFALQLRQLSLCISQETQTRGGLLLHGALAEWHGQGVIFAGRPGIGKTTLSRRLPAPWKSLCDDLTLLAQDCQGDYRAHPWPTWSRFLPGRTGERRWHVNNAVPLKAIFFLNQATEDRSEAIGCAHAVGLLVRAWSQARFGLPEGLDDARNQALRVQCFDTICRLAQTVPISLLHVSRNGNFWQTLEKELK